MRCQFPYTLMMLYTSLNCDAIGARHNPQSIVGRLGKPRPAPTKTEACVLFLLFSNFIKSFTAGGYS